MRLGILAIFISTLLIYACSDPEPIETNGILGFEILNDINGHWVGSNETPYGFFPWFAFDFRPISSSHSHSIYEGASNQNIINSVFLAEIGGEQKIMARNGGWLGSQYRATYFVLDIAEATGSERYYRLSDAVGGDKRAYIEFRFDQDSIFFDAYKDNSGSLDEPILHMSFKGANRNEDYARTAIELFEFPSTESEVNLNNAFDNLIDPDSALFLEEENDPFPKSDHGHLSDLSINFVRDTETTNQDLLLFISKNELVSSSDQTNLLDINNTVIRTIDIRSTEENYTATYLHPDEYYITIFLDNDDNGFPSQGDRSSISVLKKVNAETTENVVVELGIIIQ